MCERELETEQNCNILTPTLLAITTFLSRSPRLFNRGPGGPASLEHVPQFSIFSPTHLITNWLNFMCTAIYNCSTSTFFLWASQIALIQPVHSQGYILIFLAWMHLLFTQVHFLFWQLSWVGGQYTTVWFYGKSNIERYLIQNLFVNTYQIHGLWTCFLDKIFNRAWDYFLHAVKWFQVMLFNSYDITSPICLYAFK